MAVYSMTGYASAQQQLFPPEAVAAAHAASPRGFLGMEIRSVNSRFLDITFRLPEDFRHLEAALRRTISERLRRGKVEVRINLERAGQEYATPPDAALLQQLATLQAQVLEYLPQARPLSVSEVLRAGAGAEQTPREWADKQVSALAQKVLDALLLARGSEGGRLADMLRGRLQQLRLLAQQAIPLVPRLAEQQRQRFLTRWAEAMALGDGAGSIPDSAHERAMTEATAYAMRLDVAEEITRLLSHLDEITDLLDKGGEIGKRLDFLIQELHREANTLGSKSALLELTRISVDMKVLIEQMREQVQNIE